MENKNKLTILYGSETGTAADAAWYCAWEAKERYRALTARLNNTYNVKHINHCDNDTSISTGPSCKVYEDTLQVTILPCDELPMDQWCQHSPILFIVATAGQGDFPISMRNTWRQARLSDCQEFPSLRYAVFGLGDSTYQKYNFAAKLFHNRMKQLGAEPLVHRGLGDEEDTNGHFQEMIPWLETLWAALFVGSVEQENNPSLTPSADQTATGDKPKDGTLVTCKRAAGNKYTVVKVVSSHESYIPSGIHPQPIGRKDFFTAKVVSSERITAPSHFQEVRHIDIVRPVISLPSEVSADGSTVLQRLQYDAGDVIGVLPANPPEVVHHALRVLGIKEDSSYRIKPNSKEIARQRHEETLFDRDATAGHLLTHCIDLSAPAPASFLKMMSLVAEDEEEKERLEELASPLKLLEYITYCYRERRTAIEVLEDFPKIHVSFETFLSNLPLIRPRYYSISSSARMDEEVMSITVAKFEITTPYGRKRVGLCSKYLCDSSLLGKSITFVLDRRPFMLEDNVPVILIGPGTGVAPLRGVIRDRMYQALHCKGGNTNVADTLLFFGCRNKSCDYLYEKEWQKFLSGKGYDTEGNEILLSSIFSVETAFSRDTAIDGTPKTYVQQQMAVPRCARHILRILKSDPPSSLEEEEEDNHIVPFKIIVCGNAKHMPVDVQKALANILLADAESSKVKGEGDEEGIQNLEDAKRIVQGMRSAGCLIFDTWSV